MNKIKYLLLSFIFLNINFSNAMSRRSGHTKSQLGSESKVNFNVKSLARFFIAGINNSDTYQAILTGLRTRRDSLVFDVDNKLMLACGFEKFSKILLDYFNTNKLECFSVSNLTLPQLNFEAFFGRINEVCNYEQEQLIRLLFQTGAITIAEITEINDLTQKLGAHQSSIVSEEFYKFITRINLLSTTKYSLHDDRVKAVVFQNLLRFKLASLRKFRKYVSESNFSSPLLYGEDKILGIISIFDQINRDLLGVNFLA